MARSRSGLGTLRGAALACALGALTDGPASPPSGVSPSRSPGVDRFARETVLGAAGRPGRRSPSGGRTSPVPPRRSRFRPRRRADRLAGLRDRARPPRRRAVRARRDLRGAAAAWHGAVGLHLVRLLVAAAVAGGLVGLLLGRRAGASGGRWRRAWRGLLRDAVALAVFLATAALLLRLLPDAAPARPSPPRCSVGRPGRARLALGRCLLSPADRPPRLLPVRRPRWHMAMLAALVLLGLAIDLAAISPRAGGAAPPGLAAWTLLGTTPDHRPDAGLAVAGRRDRAAWSGASRGGGQRAPARAGGGTAPRTRRHGAGSLGRRPVVVPIPATSPGPGRSRHPGRVPGACAPGARAGPSPARLAAHQLADSRR